MKNIIVASDSFKGTLTSVEIGRAFQKIYKNTKIISISDGGEGFVESLLWNRKDFESEKIETIDDLGKGIVIKIARQNDVAYIDVASIVALHNYPLTNHLQKNTRGIGRVLNVLESDPTINKVYIGLGGSSTSDMGFYASLEMGFKYLASNGDAITDLSLVHKICTVESPTLKNKYVGLSDVDNKLLGREGALNVFGKQKGFTKNEIKQYEEYFEKLSNAIDKSSSMKAGSGAAGGLGYFILGNLNGKIESGIKTMIKLSNFSNMAKNVDYVITGEGFFDNQSFYGKAPYEIAKCAGRDKTILVAGLIKANEKKLKNTFLNWFELKKSKQSIADAIKNSNENLKDTVNEVLSFIK